MSHSSSSDFPSVQYNNIAKKPIKPENRNKRMHSFAFIALLILGGDQGVLSVITSVPITNWGRWGNFQKCPTGQFAKSFKLKTERNQHFGDDTALNGITLFCGNSDPAILNPISSYVGRYGQWGQPHLCLGGFISGFQLRVEAPQGRWDDTATNNMRAFCSHSGRYVEGDGMDFGHWGVQVHCPKGQFVCGLQTQGEEQNCGDDCTGINNIRMECCDP